jgi:citrate synthase
MSEQTPFPYSPGLDDVPCAKSAVCDIDGTKGILSYRGFPIETLAENSNFLETTALLLKGSLPTQAELDKLDAELRQNRALKYPIVEILKLLPESGHPMDALATAVAAMGAFYPGNYTEDKAARHQATIRLIAQLPTIVAAFHRARSGDEVIAPRADLDHATNFLYMLSGKEPDPFIAKLLDTCLVLHAEHSMNASTFTARVVGSSLADPFAVISGAVHTLSGPLHGGANEEVLRMLRDIGGAEKVPAWANDRVTNKKKISGFGHREYKVKDPRAKVLQKFCLTLFEKFGSTPLYDIATALEAEMERLVGHKGVYPNVDFYSGIVYDKMGIPTDLFTPIFAIARVSGWLAHWHEQLDGNRIFRPSQIYTGASVPQEYAGVSARK